ncbi:hypothetical protein M422DRAFT_264382 [Sphaerobolus stellatus SS14]|uniref:Unplaced genomic scaffold SPHSTscaffold_135, whole genome shotgun sequence n=1 Tax=Sphaerobolus stellatus (strain SS14) TaxID=990650 RepID=A0A0C9V849_SPHS4|nr:hypothetical protein M422DRAFT_264382 [Sphaerobolus stellatus SS14]
MAADGILLQSGKKPRSIIYRSYSKEAGLIQDQIIANRSQAKFSPPAMPFLNANLFFVIAFPQYQPLGGLSERELEDILPRLNVVTPPPPPGPPSDTSVKLVNDAAHPFMPLSDGDMRDPCPGVNTLASHGYLHCNGIVTPTQIINAVQDGFNMDNTLAIILTYATMLVDGNPLTNLMSIGGKSALTGLDPPKPAIIGGLDIHAVFEGDASMTRADFFLGDNHSFN